MSRAQLTITLSILALALSGCTTSGTPQASTTTLASPTAKPTGPVITNPKFPPPKQTNVDRADVTIDGCAFDYNQLVPLKFDQATLKRGDRIGATTHLGCKIERHLPRNSIARPTQDAILTLAGSNITMDERRKRLAPYLSTTVERSINGRESFQINTFDVFNNAYLVYMKSKEGSFEISMSQVDRFPEIPPEDLIHQIALLVEPFLRKFD